jgi:hypothetical protein
VEVRDRDANARNLMDDLAFDIHIACDVQAVGLLEIAGVLADGGTGDEVDCHGLVTVGSAR